MKILVQNYGELEVRSKVENKHNIIIELLILLEPEEKLLASSFFHTTPGCLGILLFRLFVSFYSKKFCVALTDRRVIVLELSYASIDLAAHMSLQYKELEIWNDHLFIYRRQNRERQLSFEWSVTRAERENFFAIIREKSVTDNDIV